MKLAAAVAALAAGATIASASPLRVIVVSNAIQKPDTEPFLAHMRFGHAASHVNNPNADVAQLLGPPRATPAAQHRKGPCMGALIRQKALEAQNAFRKAFGLPLIDHDHHQAHPAFGVMHFVPPPGTNGGATFVNVKGSDATGWWGTTKGGDKVHIETESKPIALTPFRVGIPPRRPHHEHHHNHPHAHMVHHAHGGPSFMNRLEEALMALGPWEGRAVAFVIGAGIGVLIRMLWVFGVLIFRGCSNDGKEYEAVPEDDDEEDDDMRRTPLTAPPTYVYPIDEKVGFEHVEVPKAQPGN